MTSCLLGELVDEIIPRWCGEEDHGIDGLPRGSTCHVSLGGDAAARLRCERLEEDARGMAAESEVEDRRPVCQLSGWCLSFQPEVEHQYLCDSALHARTGPAPDIVFTSVLMCFYGYSIWARRNRPSEWTPWLFALLLSIGQLACLWAYPMDRHRVKIWIAHRILNVGLKVIAQSPVTLGEALGKDRMWVVGAQALFLCILPIVYPLPFQIHLGFTPVIFGFAMYFNVEACGGTAGLASIGPLVESMYAALETLQTGGQMHQTPQPQLKCFKFAIWLHCCCTFVSTLGLYIWELASRLDFLERQGLQPPYYWRGVTSHLSCSALVVLVLAWAGFVWCLLSFLLDALGYWPGRLVPRTGEWSIGECLKA